MIQNEEDIISLIQEDKWMMDVLKNAKSLHLSDWWICAGFVRSKIWDIMHGLNEKTPLPDVDVIYYDSSNIRETKDQKLEGKLYSRAPSIPWSVKNQARMHLVNGVPPYISSEDAISKFPETATALGVKLDEDGNVLLTAPHGVQDAINLEIKPTPYFMETKDRIDIYKERVRKKDWNSTWHNVKVNLIKTK